MPHSVLVCLSVCSRAQFVEILLSTRPSALIVHPDLQCRSGLAETWAKSLLGCLHGRSCLSDTTLRPSGYVYRTPPLFPAWREVGLELPALQQRGLQTCLSR